MADRRIGLPSGGPNMTTIDHPKKAAQGLFTSAFDCGHYRSLEEAKLS